MLSVVSRPALSRAAIGRSGLLIGAATLAIALSSAPARAECAATADGGFLCTGTTQGHVSASDGAVTTVAAGATVNANATTGVAVRYDEAGDLVVNGTVLSALGTAVEAAGAGTHRITIGAAGRIQGTTAIASPDDDAFRAVEIDNAGTIQGDVTLRGESADSVYQRLGGIMTGNVSLGAGDDAFYREGRGDVIAAAVNGTLDGGAGTDIYGVRMTGSGTVTFDPLPTGFERYGVDLCGCDVTATIAAGQLNAGLTASGEGRVINLANITVTGDAPAIDIVSDFEDDLDGDFGLTVINRATVTATGTDENQNLIQGDVFARFVNEGTINLSGAYRHGISMQGGFGSFDPSGEATFVNRGTITSNSSSEDNTAVAIGGTGLNTGTISATGAGNNGVRVDGFGSGFVNDTTGTITADGTAVTLIDGADLVNRGLIESKTGPAVSIQGSIFADRSTIENDASGTIRGGDGVAIARDNGGGNAGAAIANKGTIQGDIVLDGNQPDILWMAEGSKIQGGADLGGGDDIVVADIGRVNRTGNFDTSGLIDGTLDSGGGNDTLWLRAGENRSANVIAPTVAGYEGGTVYEAAGANTVLRLGGPLDTEGNPDTNNKHLRVAGDGTVVIDMNISTGGTETPAITVEEGSTARWFDGEAQGTNLVLEGTVSGGFAGTQVDATHARRVELVAQKGEIGVAGGTALRTGEGTQVLLDSGTRVRIAATTKDYNAVGIHAIGSDIVNRGSIYEDLSSNPTAANMSKGVIMEGGSFRNERPVNGGRGQVETHDTAISVIGGGLIVNDGDIVSHHGDAIQATDGGLTRIVNGARGTIRGHVGGRLTGTAGAAITGDAGDQIVENAGTIEGHVLLGAGNDAYIATGGKLTGNLDLGAGNDTVLTRNGAPVDVTGTVSGGAGADAYGKSFSTSGNFDLATNTVPADFELHGVEASGAATEVTLSSAAAQTRGVRMFGDGKVINTANFDVTGQAGQHSAFEAASLDGASALAFENRGTITTDIVGVSGDALRSFANSGTINAAGGALDVDFVGLGQAFSFSNSGTMASSKDDVATVRIRADSFTEDGKSADFSNQGTINSTGADGIGVDMRVGYGTGEFANGGTIAASGRRGTGSYLASEQLLTASNAGTITASGVAGTALALTSTGSGLPGTAEDCKDGTTPALAASFTNTGTLRANGGGVDDEGRRLFASAAAISIGGDRGIVRLTNAAGGLIEATGASSSAVIATGEGTGYGGVDVDATLRLFELDNAGTIRGGADTTVAAGQSIAAGGDTDLRRIGETGTERVIAGGIQTVNTTDHIRNLAGGQIFGNVDLGTGNDIFENLGRLEGDLRLGDGDDSFIYAASSVFTGMAYGGNGTDTLLVDLNGNGSINFDQFRGFETLSQRGSGTVAIRGTTDMATLNIAGSNISVAAGTRFDTQGDTALAGSDAAETLTVNGTVGGSVDMGGGNDTVTLANGGLVEGDVLMGAGDDRVVLAGGTVTGKIDGGAGSDTIAFQITGDTSNLPNVLNFESLDVSGNGLLTLAMNQDFDTVTLRDGADLTLNPGEGNHSIGNIVGDDSAQTVIINTALTGGVSLGGGDDTLAMSLAGTLSGALDGGAGTDALNLNLTGASSIAGGVNGFETINVTGASPLTLGATIAAGQSLNFDGSDNSLIVDAGGSILGTANGGAGRDRLTFNTVSGQTSMLAAGQVQNFEDLVANGAGTLSVSGNAAYQTIAVNGGHLTIANGVVTSGSTQFDGANNVLTLGAGATLTGAVDGGEGTDRLVLSQGANEVRQLGSLNYASFEQLETGGPGELQIDTNAGFDSVDMFGGKMTVMSGATLTTPTLTGSAAANTLDVRGTLAGNVDLGDGNDRLVIAGLNSVTGTRTGGAGTDTLDFRTAGTYATPVSWDGTGFDSFEALNVSSGVLSLTGNANYQTVSVTGGRLIGQAGTTITSANAIVVNQGATFGSAGIVNGNIDVRGTLSPGASPGTMTVNGNVSFAAGSNLLLEVAPTGSDLLNISGTLTVANGAAIDITGMLTATPGGALDLVVAQGGITGGFGTINKSATVFGFVATRGNRIQIVGEFANDPAFGTNARASIAYANAVLGAGQKVQAFTGALPVLVDQTGRSNAAAFARLTPEAYGSATQASIDNGLTITDTMRNMRFTAPQTTGFYGFAQGLAQWNRLKGDAGTGASASSSNSSGLIGGIGYAMEGARLGGFIGTLKADQTLAGLDASTKTEGMVGGVFADASIGGLGLHALIAYDGSEARTRRTIPGGGTATGRYDLGGWVADFSVDYAQDLGGFRIAPRAGVTYVAAKRQAVVEGGGAFALAVDGGRTNAWFGDAALAVSMDAGAGITPYLEAGVRHMLSGNGTAVSGRFADTPTIGPVTVTGVARDRTVARLSAGIGADLAKGVRLNVGYGAELGDTTRHNLNGGITIAF